jgi:hypothetical protein
MSFGKPVQVASLHKFSHITKDCYFVVIGFLACFLAYTPLIANQPDMVMIEGIAVADEGELPVEDLTVSINGKKFTVQIDGRYAARVAQADIYQLRFDSPSPASIHLPRPNCSGRRTTNILCHKPNLLRASPAA